MDVGGRVVVGLGSGGNEVVGGGGELVAGGCSGKVVLLMDMDFVDVLVLLTVLVLVAVGLTSVEVMFLQVVEMDFEKVTASQQVLFGEGEVVGSGEGRGTRGDNPARVGDTPWPTGFPAVWLYVVRGGAGSKTER